jgi:hypothetical protein
MGLKIAEYLQSNSIELLGVKSECQSLSLSNGY